MNGNQAIFLNAGRKPEDCKMVARALFSFQVRAAMQAFGAKIFQNGGQPEHILLMYYQTKKYYKTLFENRTVRFFLIFWIIQKFFLILNI